MKHQAYQDILQPGEILAEAFQGKDSMFKLEYMQAFQFLQRKDMMGRKFLSELGALTSMLITTDLIYTSKVTLPTGEEMGYIVYILKKGAVFYL